MQRTQFKERRHGISLDSFEAAQHLEHITYKKNHSAFPKRYSYAGFLSIHNKSNYNWKRLYFVLQHNHLLCGDNASAERLSACIPLEGSTICQTPKSSGKAFELTARKSRSKKGQKKYYFHAELQSLCSKWIECLQRASTLKIKDIYRFRYLLGNDSSNSTKVIASKHRVTNEEFAIKIIDKRKCNQLQLQKALNIIKNISNPYIVPLCDCFENRKYLYLVMEMCFGGQLLDQIAILNDYTVQHCMNIIHQLANGIQYMHSVGIIHKDLKIQNVLCVRDSIKNVKICHYGLSNAVMIDGNAKQTFVKQKELVVVAFIRDAQELLSYKNNTFYLIPTDVISICFQYFGAFTTVDILSYPAPEVVMSNIYNESVDYWSIGIISYILICGYPPFNGNKDHEIVDSILKHEVTFDGEDWKHINNETKELIKGLLDKDPSERKTCEDVLKLQELSKFHSLALNDVAKLTKIKNWLKQSSI